MSNVEPTPLKLLAAVVFASILVGIFVGLYWGFGRGRGVTEFLEDAQELAGRVQWLKSQDLGSQVPFSITVPEGCELRFENENVVAVVDGGTHQYESGINIDGDPLGPGEHSLTLARVENGVEVNVG